jgi:hypothetical protein
VLTDHKAVAVQPSASAEFVEHLAVEVGVVGRIEVHQVEGGGAPITFKPAFDVATHHLDVRFAFDTVANGLQVCAANAGGGWVVFYGNNSLSSTLKGFTGHDTAATTQIQPAATIEASSEDIHHRFANTRRRGPCVLAWGAQQAAATGEA